MKATLLIKNIHKLYPCVPGVPVLENAFIACFHERIIAIGHSDWSEYGRYVDIDLTRVIDATGEVVIPSFTEPCFLCPPEERDSLVRVEERLSLLYANGILNLATPCLEYCRRRIHQNVVYRPLTEPLHLISLTESLKELSGDWLLTTSGFQNGSAVYSLQFLMARLYYELRISPLEILDHVCRESARAIGLAESGELREGMLADLLILNVSDFEQYLKTFGKPLIHRMVYHGIPVYPHKIRC